MTPRMTLYGDATTAEQCKDLVPVDRVRAVVFRDGKILLVKLPNIGLTVLPGGGVVPGESLVSALRREVKEETGYDITDITPTFELTEYYADEAWRHVFFRCKAVGEADEPDLTEEEKAYGLVPALATFDEALACFSETSSTHPFAENIVRREFLGLIHSYEQPE